MEMVSLRVVRHTRNFDAMLAFYRDRLGMCVLEAWDRPGSQGALLVPGMQVGAASIEVLNSKYQVVEDARPANVDLALEVKAVDDWLSRLRAHGVAITSDLEDKPWGHRAFSVKDPDGMTITLYQVVEP